MKAYSFPRCGCLFLLLLLGWLTAQTASATITVTNYWRMGENDPGAASGNQFTDTVDVVRGWVITNTPTIGGFPFFNRTYPAYTNNVSAVAAAEAVSSLSADYPSNQYGIGAVIPGLTNNFGIECWLNPTVTNSGAVVVYNGNTSNSGCGLWQSGTNILGFIGGAGFFGSAPVPTNIWTHVALVRDRGTNTLYVNGVPAGSSTLSPASPAGNFLVAADNNHAGNYYGLVDEIRVFTFVPGQFSTNDLLIFASTVVENTNDSGMGSLRQVIAQAPNGYTVTFSPNLSGQTNILASTLQITNNLTIDASALPGGITISGHNSVQIFNLSDTNTVFLNSLNLINGYALGTNGGAIENNGYLQLNDCTLSGNVAIAQATNGGNGGALYNYGHGSVELNECTLTANAASQIGGCIYDTGNDSGSGYGVTIRQCTLSANAAEVSGGGVYTLNASGLYVYVDIISSNLPSDIDVEEQGFVDFQTGCLIGILVLTKGGYISEVGINTYITNTVPNLAPLGYYGGPTPTMPPLPGSPAIGAGVYEGLFGTDQRGYPRVQNGQFDLGAVELPRVQFTASPTNGWLPPLPVQFAAPLVDSDGTTITQWDWSFGDGATSGTQSPLHTYSQTGEFYPGLLVTNSLGLILAASGPAIDLNLPSFTSAGVAGTNLVLNGANGLSGHTYYVLATTNLTLPRSQWQSLTTNTWTANGNFSLVVTNAVNPAVPDQFFLLEAQ